MVVTRNGQPEMIMNYVTRTEYRYRYMLPIGAVDTHRPKPRQAQPEKAATNSAREYYGENS
jgi:hypothetical protein